MNSSRLVFLLTVCATFSFAETVKDREGAVRKDRATMENDARWIYNDFERGFAEAKRTGKPLLVVLRCVPCLSCMGIDTSVLAEPGLVSLLDQFVCVRLINANAIDLARFQFDYDLSFTTMFFNGDGTVYGRYGSWVHQKDSQDKTPAGYQRALESVLAIHRACPDCARQQGGHAFQSRLRFRSLQGVSAGWIGEKSGRCARPVGCAEGFWCFLFANEAARRNGFSTTFARNHRLTLQRLSAARVASLKWIALRGSWNATGTICLPRSATCFDATSWPVTAADSAVACGSGSTRWCARSH
jgi:hypothetical protein